MEVFDADTCEDIVLLAYQPLKIDDGEFASGPYCWSCIFIWEYHLATYVLMFVLLWLLKVKSFVTFCLCIKEIRLKLGNYLTIQTPNNKVILMEEYDMWLRFRISVITQEFKPDLQFI